MKNLHLQNKEKDKCQCHCRFTSNSLLKINPNEINGSNDVNDFFFRSIEKNII